MSIVLLWLALVNMQTRDTHGVYGTMPQEQTSIVDAYVEGPQVPRFDPPNGAIWLIIEEDGRLTAHDSHGRSANLPIQCDPPKAENISWQNCQILRSGPFKRYRKVQ